MAKRIVSALARHPGRVAIGGAVVLLLTPFVFFPEIMGNTGVTRASAFRNGGALAVLIIAGAVTGWGCGALTWRTITKARNRDR